MLRIILLIAKGILRSKRSRRIVMFYTVLAAMLMLFFGATLLDSRLRQHPFLLLGFWAVCGWLTILSALLAMFDLLMVRRAARAERRQLESEYLEQRRRSKRHGTDTSAQ